MSWTRYILHDSEGISVLDNDLLIDNRCNPNRAWSVNNCANGMKLLVDIFGS